MSLFEDQEYEWRDTYFVMFKSAKRPQLNQVRDAIARLNRRFELTNLTSDDAGRFEAMTIRSPEDFAALDISFLEGDDVIDQRNALCKELRGCARDADEEQRLAQLPQCDVRFDVLHFERLDVPGGEEEPSFDPGALLAVVETLAQMTDGIGVDPQSGTML
ncbi:MAG: hypothetical protein K1X74_16390 [Pirellulales bacterium]|nr:hypothetical protein [Pirellulales bacterium]